MPKKKTDKNLTADDIVTVADENLLPSGSRAYQDTKTATREIYPKPIKIVKKDIPEEMGYEKDLRDREELGYDEDADTFMP